MNWHDAIKMVDKSDDHYVEIDKFAQMFGIECLNYDEDFDNRCKKYFVSGYTWICTDKRVGLAVYFCDGEAVAVSGQTGRRMTEYIGFVSEQARDKMKSVLMDIVAKQSAYSPGIVDMDVDLSSWGR